MKLEMRIFNNFYSNHSSYKYDHDNINMHKEPQKVRDHVRTVKPVCWHEGPVEFELNLYKE